MAEILRPPFPTAVSPAHEPAPARAPAIEPQEASVPDNDNAPRAAVAAPPRRPEPHALPPDYFQRFAASAAVYEPTPEERQAEVRDRLRELRRERLERARPAIRPDDYRAVIEGTLADTSALQFVRRWRSYQKRGQKPSMNFLTLCGLTGRGKTLAAAWLLAEEGGYYTTADELRRKVVSPSWRERDWFEGFCLGGCVVVDDVGTEFDAAGANMALFELVNRRQANAKWFTVLTGNLTEAEFRARYDERTIRRIEHAGAIVTVGGDDLRRGGGAP